MIKSSIHAISKNQFLLFLILYSLVFSHDVFAQHGNQGDEREGVLATVSSIDPGSRKAGRESALHSAQFKIKKAFAEHDTAEMIESGISAGKLLQQLGRFDESMDVLRQLLTVAGQSHYVEIVRIYNLLTVNEIQRSNLNVALRYALITLATLERQQDEGDISGVFVNIGMIYFKLNDYADALKYFEKCVVADLSHMDHYSKCQLMVGLAKCYNKFERYRESRRSLIKAMELDRTLADHPFAGAACHAFGLMYRGINEQDSAILFFNKSLELAKQANDKLLQLENLNMTARGYIRLGRVDVARSLLVQAETLSAASTDQVIMADIYESCAELFEKTGDFNRAYSYQRKHEKIYNVLTADRLAELVKVEAEFREDENRKIIEDQVQILELKEEVIREHRLLSALTIVIAVLLLIMTIYFFLLFRLKQKQNKLLDRKIHERTMALSNSMKLTARNLEEQSHFLIKTTSEMKKYLKTLKGLVVVISSNPNDTEALQRANVFIDKAEIALNRVNKQVLDGDLFSRSQS